MTSASHESSVSPRNSLRGKARKSRDISFSLTQAPLDSR